ncbi:hypothetical protein [Nocardioides sp.]|uniref:hypothetical protein n=1 Tax=Nocardioides sp. TaxID=35761 RepID=UPI00356B0C5B
MWQEFRQLGAAVRADADLESEARAVCDEMARRARANIETIVTRLRSAGYRFHTNDDSQKDATAWLPPSNRAQQAIEWLESHFDAIPMTLVSWLTKVGDVWLVGTHPQWTNSAAADPLVIEAEASRYPLSSVVGYYAEELDAWEFDRTDEVSSGPFVLPLAPDRLHKSNVSGGAPYGLILPDATVEGTFAAEAPMPFVGYLNWVFEHGGFPGPITDENGWSIRRELAKDLHRL